MATWDRRAASAQQKLQAAAVAEQVRDVVAPFSPYWRERFAELGVKPGSIATVADLESLPAVGERDVCPDGDPASAARLVVQASETGYALHAPGPALRRALVKRAAAAGSAYRRQVEADTRPTSYAWAGLGFRFPLAYTRADLDVVARAGARLWQVLGLGSADLLVSAVPVETSVEHTALSYAALASGTPAFYPGADRDRVAEVLRLAPATVLAVRSEEAASLVDDLVDRGLSLAGLGTLLLVGAPTAEERAAALEALHDGGAGEAVVLAVHAPSGARLLWAECRQSRGATGLHTYPDLDVVGTVDPETGENVRLEGGPAELVLSQLGMRGSALLRWRTGDLVQAPVAHEPCPDCGRTVPRVPADLRRGALVVPYATRRAAPARLDLRAVAGALVGRPDIADWRVVVAPSRRDGADELLVHLATTHDGDPADVAVGAARDLRAVTGILPTQFVAAPLGELATDVISRGGEGALTSRISRR